MKSVLIGALIFMMTFSFAQTAETLSTKQQSMITISAFATTGDLDKLRTSLNEGLDSGLAVNEIGEILLQLYAYAGFPRSLNAQNVLTEVLKNRKAKGINDIYGVEPSPVPETGRYDIGRETINRIFHYSATQSRPQSTGYTATTDVFLKEHLFADIIGRDNLAIADRELVTVSILSALLTVNPQLASHMNGALNAGNSETQLEELTKVFTRKVGKKEGKNAQKVLTQVLKSRKNTTAVSASSDATPSETIPEIPKEARLTPFDVGKKNDAYAQYFIGQSYLSMLSTEQVAIGNVTFEPGCRNNWHIHHKGGQILLVTAGRGYYQEWGKPAQELKAGDVVNIPPETKHWHGAAKDSWFSHIAVEVPEKGASNEWLEPVNKEEYSKLK